MIAALEDEAADHAARVHLQDTERERLDAAGLPLMELPLLASGIDLAALYALADALTDQGLPG